MAKIDKSQLTKEERRRIKQQSRQSKLANVSTPVTSTLETQYHVLCLKHGVKYSADYVNKLYNMVKRNCTLNIEFWCLTDDSTSLNKNIKVLPLPKGLEGWWCKPYMFSNELPISGTILYIDLDVVIANNIDRLFTYEPDSWCTIRDFTRAMRPKWQKYNSSVVRFKTGQLHNVWHEFNNNKQTIQRKFFGDQDWLYEATRKNPAVLYPDEWIRSWKWEIRKSKEWAPGGRKGSKVFKTVENVTPRQDCCITVFHGDPNPHNCADPWVVNNWK